MSASCVQRRLVVAQPALLEDIARTLIQCCQCLEQTPVGVIFQILLLDLSRRIGDLWSSR